MIFHCFINSIQEMLPFYAMRHNMTCDSVFLESYVWKDYYNVRYAIWENKALLWLMENEGRCFSAMPLCREEDLPGAFAAIEEYFNEELGYPLVINLADEYAVKYLNLPEDKYLVEEQVDSRDYLYNGAWLLRYSSVWVWEGVMSYRDNRASIRSRARWAAWPSKGPKKSGPQTGFISVSAPLYFMP